MTKKIVPAEKSGPRPTGSARAQPGAELITALVHKEIKWMGDAKEVMSAFPDEVKQAGGEELFRVQCGFHPNDAAPIGSVGKGTYEIRISKAGGWFRILYVAKFGNAVYVLHAFQKKTNTTSKRDIELGKARYAMAVADAKSATAPMPKAEPAKAKD